MPNSLTKPIIIISKKLVRNESDVSRWSWFWWAHRRKKGMTWRVTWRGERVAHVWKWVGRATSPTPCWTPTLGLWLQTLIRPTKPILANPSFTFPWCPFVAPTSYHLFIITKDLPSPDTLEYIWVEQNYLHSWITRWS